MNYNGHTYSEGNKIVDAFAEFFGNIFIKNNLVNI